MVDVAIAEAMRKITHAASCRRSLLGSMRYDAKHATEVAICASSERRKPRSNVIGTTRNLPTAKASKPMRKISSARFSVIRPSATKDGPALLSERRARPFMKVNKKSSTSVRHCAKRSCRSYCAIFVLRSFECSSAAACAASTRSRSHSRRYS